MTDKFAEYYSTEEKIQELSQYVHENMKIIGTKMLSEMRRKLDLTPDLTNKDGYVSLMVSLIGRIFDEEIYSLCGYCQSLKLDVKEVIPLVSLRMLVSLLEGKNPLNGLPRDDIREDRENFERMYKECISYIRSVVEALPK